jgi:uncharacterized protein
MLRVVRRLLPLLALVAMLSPSFTSSAQTSSAPTSSAQTPAPATAKRSQYLYVLRVAPRLYDQNAWTDADNAAVGRHFARLKQGVAAGQVILAGRTAEPLDKTFGLVIFEADDEAAARAFMEADPAVVSGQMTATLHPYAVALLRK